MFFYFLFFSDDSDSMVHIYCTPLFCTVTSLALLICLPFCAGEPDPPSLSAVEKDVKSGESLTLSCSVYHFCPPHPPTITWSREGSVTVQSEALTGGQYKLTSNLTFNLNASDHQRLITCAAQHHGGKSNTKSVTLRVTCEWQITQYTICNMV